MKITIDTDNFDLTALETLIVRTIVRTVKTLARDNLLPWALAQPVAELTPDAPTQPTNGHAAPAVEAAPEPTSSWSEPEPPPPPVFNRHNVVEPPAKPKKRRDRHPLIDICPAVDRRPQGYIDMQEAAALIGGGDNMKVQLYTWVKGRQINGRIVCSVKPPTKGLPGRVMVSRAEVLERNQLRMMNAAAGAGRGQRVPLLAAEQPAQTVN